MSAIQKQTLRRVLLVEDSALASQSFDKVIQRVIPNVKITLFRSAEEVSNSPNNSRNPFCHIAINADIGMKLAQDHNYDLLVLDTQGDEDLEERGSSMGREVAKAYRLSTHGSSGVIIAASSQSEENAKKYWSPFSGEPPYNAFFEKGVGNYAGIETLIRKFF